MCRHRNFLECKVLDFPAQSLIHESSVNSRAFNNSLLLWAVACSILLHILLVFVMPGLQFDSVKKPEVLLVDLAPTAKPIPIIKPVEPVKAVDPIKRIQPKPLEKPAAKPASKTVSQPSPLSAPASEVKSQAIMTASPEAESKPTVSAPSVPIASAASTEPAKATAVTEIDINGARGQYADMLRREIAKDKNYPNIARTRNQQGEVVLDVRLDSNGNVITASVRTSSGYESLDKEALNKIKRISPFPLPPDALKGRSFNVTVPISFKLDV